MNYSLPHTETVSKTLLHIENRPINSRLLRKIMQQCPDIAILSAHYGEDTLVFIRKHQPDYIVVSLDALGNNINHIYHSLVMLNEIYTGKIIVSGYDTSSMRILTGWMSRLVFIDFPLTRNSLLDLLGNKNHTTAV